MRSHLSALGILELRAIGNAMSKTFIIVVSEILDTVEECADLHIQGIPSMNLLVLLWDQQWFAKMVEL
jgi:hypothetical protein